MLAMDAAAAFATAQEAVTINPLNPYAHYALAASYLRASRFDEAARHGQIAADIAANAHNAFFFQGISALIALAAGDLDGCIRVYETIAHRAPQFRPPLRGLTVLSLVKGDQARAARYAALLARAEPGFALETLLFDDHYPAVTMRTMGLLQAASQRL
jgi:tetratricopeptide (TPR) repeat protein